MPQWAYFRKMSVESGTKAYFKNDTRSFRVERWRDRQASTTPYDVVGQRTVDRVFSGFTTETEHNQHGVEDAYRMTIAAFKPARDGSARAPRVQRTL